MTITNARPSRRASVALFKASLTCAAALTAGVATHVRAEHIPYEIDTLALPDAAHADSSGDRFVIVVDMNGAGQVIGTQTFYDTSAKNDDGSDRFGQSAWFFGPEGISQVGLYDGVHVDNDTNYHFSDATQLNQQGYAAGHSYRFLDTAGVETAGQSAWLHYQGDTAQIGLIGTDKYEHDGRALSTIVKLNDGPTGDHPHVVGTSVLFRGGTDPATQGNDAGIAAWIHVGGITGESQRVGPIDAEHSRTDSDDAGYLFQSTTVEELNNLGTVAGEALRYHQTTRLSSGLSLPIGKSAWIQTLDSSTPTLVGFRDAEHTRNASDLSVSPTLRDGTRISTIVALNNNDLVVGHSNRYDPVNGQSRGQTAWRQLASETAPTRLGYDDATHTAGNGTKDSDVLKLNDANYAMGVSYRYNGGAVNKGTAGKTAWLHSDQNGLERIGLTDPEHTGENGFQNSTPTLLNDVGHAAGTSSRFILVGEPGFETREPRGTSAWLHTSGTGSARVGLFEGSFEEAHTKDDGTQISSVIALNNPGQVVGHSTRYLTGETATWGQSAWISDGTVHQQIGLVDDNHRRANGFQHSTVLFLNDAGQAAGYSFRYNLQDPPDNAQPGEPLPNSGQTGWFWDGTTSIPLMFSEENQSNFTDIKFLSDSGIVLGSYTDFSGTGEVARAFYWNYNLPEADRFHDLGSLPDVAIDWQRLSQALEMSDLGHIRGLGFQDGQSLPYLMTPVPEPTGLALVALSGLALLPRRRRR